MKENTNIIKLNEESFKVSAEDLFTDDEASLAAIDAFGIKYMYPWQRLVVANIMDSFEEFSLAKQENNEKDKNNEEKDQSLKNDNDITSKGKQIVLLPTGAGKSLCFQVPALLLPGPSLIIYPLLALMSDQERRMIAGNLKCVVFRGGQNEKERQENFEKIKNGAKIIIANPEVLGANNFWLSKKLKEFKICHIAIDEAHCVSEWGDSFRPAYLEMGKIIKEIAAPVVTAFTATASPEVLARVSQVLFDNEAHIVRSDSDRPNIHYYVRKAPAKKKAALILAKTEKKPMIIFCSTRNRTEDMSRELNLLYGKDFSKFYHAGLSREEKTHIEEWFFNQKDKVLCATCAYGMGVDKKDIHTVVHLDVPQTAEAYIQEAGRGGRNGSIANAILLWNESDKKKFEGFEKGSRKAALMEFATTNDCRRQALLDALGAENAFCDGCDLCDSRQKNQMIDKKIKNTLQKKYTVSVFQGFLKKVLWKLHEKKVLIFDFERQLESPGEKLFDPEEIMLHMIGKSKKYFTKESLEEKIIPVLNEKSIKWTKACIWEHHSFCEVFNTLQDSGKIKIEKTPWKGRLNLRKN